MSSHKYQYIKGRPRLTTKVKGKNGFSKYVHFLIDSGADYTIISQVTATTLGIDYNKIKSKEFKMINSDGSIFKTKKTKLSIILANKELLIPVQVSENFNIQNLLGRIGVFKHFDILFREIKEQVFFNS